MIFQNNSMFSIDEKLSNLISFLISALGITGKNEQNDTLKSGVKKDIESSFANTVFDSGRFSNVIQKNYKHIHALQVVREDTTSSFILALQSNGTATMCRGWQYLFFNSGPQVNETEHIREQLGYKGVWYRNEKDGWLNITLSFDDSLCAHIGEYSHLIPNHSKVWNLRCFPFLFKGPLAMEESILACQFVDLNEVFGEDQPHVIYDNVIQENWLLLGAGNGLLIKMESNDQINDQLLNFQIKKAKDMVLEGAWQYSF